MKVGPVQIGSHADPPRLDVSKYRNSSGASAGLAVGALAVGIQQDAHGHIVAFALGLAVAALLGWLAVRSARDGEVQRAWLDRTLLTVQGKSVRNCGLSRAATIRLGWTMPWPGRPLYRVLIARQTWRSWPVRFILRDSEFCDIAPAQLRLLADAIGDRSAFHGRSSRAPRSLRRLADRHDANLARIADEWTFRTSQRGSRQYPP
jgi:hypothetical protein